MNSDRITADQTRRISSLRAFFAARGNEKRVAQLDFALANPRKMPEWGMALVLVNIREGY